MEIPARVNSARPAEAALQKFRHGEHVGAQVKRDKDPAQNQQDQAGQPFKRAHRQARTGAGAGQPDEVLSGDIRNKQRRPDGKPAHVAAGQEVVGRGAFLAGKVEADGKDNHKVNSDNCDVYTGQCFVGEMCRGFAHTPPSAAGFGSEFRATC